MTELVLNLLHGPEELASLPTLLTRLQAACATIAARLHKTTIVCYKIYPGSLNIERASVFDKNWIVFTLVNATPRTADAAHSYATKQFNFTVEANKLLSDGGIAAKSVKLITDKSRIIKEQLNSFIEKLLGEFVIRPQFFCQSVVVRQVFDLNKAVWTVNRQMFR